jgi:hypothetical protein
VSLCSCYVADIRISHASAVLSASWRWYERNDAARCSQAYDFMLLKLENRVTIPNLTPIMVNAVGSSSLIIEVMAVIRFRCSLGGWLRTPKNRRLLTSFRHKNWINASELSMILSPAGADKRERPQMLRNSAVPLVTGQFTSSFSAVSKTVLRSKLS